VFNPPHLSWESTIVFGDDKNPVFLFRQQLRHGTIRSMKAMVPSTDHEKTGNLSAIRFHSILIPTTPIFSG